MAIDSWLPFKTHEHITASYLFYQGITYLEIMYDSFWNTLLACLLVYPCAMLRILQYRLSHPQEFIKKTKNVSIETEQSEDITEEEMYKFLVHCVKDHLIVIK